MAPTNANLIWKIADLLRGPYQPNQYGDVILPFTILRRLDCILEHASRRLESGRKAKTPAPKGRGKSADLDRLVDDDDLRAELEAAVEEANTSVSRAEAIRRFRVLPGAWSEEDGQLTPSLKLKRSVVLRQVRDDVEDLYR